MDWTIIVLVAITACALCPVILLVPIIPIAMICETLVEIFGKKHSINVPKETKQETP